MSTPEGKNLLVQRSSRWSRLVVAFAALAIVASVTAQNAVSTLAGSGSAGSANGSGTLASFQFSNPSAAAVDAAGNLFITDSANHTIRQVTPAGVVTTFAGTAGSAGSADGAGTTVARFNFPHGIAIDGAGNLYVADSSNHTIRMITSAGVVSTLAGTALSSGSTNATGALARFNSPLGITADRAGVGSAAANLFVADTQNHTIRQVVVASGVVTTLAGTAGVPGSANATGIAATFSHPDALVTNAAGTEVYVADTFNNLIRKVVVSTQAVTTLAGSGAVGSTDGFGTATSFNNPAGIAFDGANLLLIADTFNHTIRTFTLSTGAVATYAGSAGLAGSVNGLSTAARFNLPSGIAYSAFNNSVNIVDTNNQLVRKISTASAPSITSQPSSASVAVGGSTTFTVAASGNPPVTYQWQIQAGGTGAFANIVPSATYTGSTTATLGINGATALMNGDKFQAVISNGVGTAATSSIATLTVTQPPVFTSASTASFTPGTPFSFTVTASGSPAPQISYTGAFPSWAQFNTLTGVISGTPPDTVGSPFTFTITATNTAGTVNQTFTLTALTGPVITTQPVNQTVSPGTNAAFGVVANAGSGTLTYQWQRRAYATSDVYFSLVDNGHYVNTTSSTLTILGVGLSDNGDLFQVVVSSGAGTPATSTPALLTVAQAPVITSLASATFVENQFNPGFTIQATGSPAPTYQVTQGLLPSGVTLNGTSGLLSGTPVLGSSATPVWSFVVTATNGIFPNAQQSFSLVVSATALVPAFTVQPVSVSTSLGQTASFTVTVTGTPTPTIQWERQPAGGFGFFALTNDATFSGVNTPTLTITNPTSAMNGDVYRAVASSTSGSAASNNASLTLVIGTSLSTYAGSPGTFGSTDGTGSAARFNTPSSIAVDLVGNVYVADSANNVIRKIAVGGIVTTLAGTPGAGGSADGIGAAARFNAPSGVAVNSIGSVYVADTFNHTIRVITAQGVVTTLAGYPGISGITDGGRAADGTSLARFTYPAGVAIDQAGTVYVADTANHAIRRILPDGTVSVFAGLPGFRGALDGAGTGARFANPNGIAVDSAGNVFVADSFNHAIRRISTVGVVTTYSGTLGTGGSLDNPPLFNQPSGVAVDISGNVYVADTYNDTIRRIAPNVNTLLSAIGGVVTTLAGSPGAVGSVDGIGNTARLNLPYGIAVDASANIYVADTRNNTIRRSGSVTAPQISTNPVSTVIPAGGAGTFTVTATGAPTPGIFQWQRQLAIGSGFTNITNDGTFSGANTANLTITNVTSDMNGDQYRVVVSNLISPDAISTAATLTVGTAPVFTSAATATFKATEAGAFTVSASGVPTPTFSATGLPTWASLDASTGVISGTPPNTGGSPFTVTVTARNGLATNQTLTLIVNPAIVAPTISAQPGNLSIDQGQTATFSVNAVGTSPLTYQWRRDGTNLPGASGPTLTISGVQPSNAGTYSVTVSNAAGAITSNTATLVVNTAPVFAAQPRAQIALAGSTVVLTVEAIGGTTFTYQWRKNGVPIVGANGTTLTLPAITADSAGNYDVLVSNSLGQVGSSLAQVTVVNAPIAPVITAQPVGQTVLAGGQARLAVSATGAPSPAYQWRKNGANIGNANNATYLISNVQAGDAANYDVVVSSSAGSVTSNSATLRVIARSYAGTYFGSFGNGLGNFAIFVRNDNTGVFLGYLPNSIAPVMSLTLTVSDAGQFSFSQATVAGETTSANSDEPARAAALGSVNLVGTIASDGTVSGNIQGGASGSLSGSRAPETGGSQGVAGLYRAGATSSAATAYLIVGPNTQSFAVVQSGNVTDGGTGTVTNSGQVNIVTNRSVIAVNVNSASRILTGTVTGAVSASLTGGSEGVLAVQRLVNISSRARVGTGDTVAIAGFVIAGDESKPVLIRAVGPTLGTAPFNVAGVLASPKLELFRGQTLLTTNTGIAGNRVTIDAASQQAGAFALGSSGADAAILTTLAPGNYTAVVSSNTATAGVALVEVYDLSSPSPGQKLLNIATRASAGAADNTLIAGFVVPAGASKRVLVRGVGPGLAAFGVAGVISQPTLLLLNGSNTIAQNTNWNTSPDAAAITAASAQVGAFGLANADSAMVVTLAPGNYTAQVVGAGGATGVALIEVYELP